jgi:hypothetical protein
MTEVVLLPRFFQQIRVHLVANYLDAGVRPVILGIFGRSGDGKSAQLVSTLDRCHVETIRVNAGDLESGLAGEPGKLIVRTYAAASLAIEKGTPAAVLVDDVDTTVGEWELNTGTVNHQQVLAELMHIADRPVDRSRNCPRRVPVFVTGNHLRRLYPPLRRHGRMSVFAWRPTPPEVREVVAGLFDGMCADHALDRLVAEFGDQTLAFYAEVRRAVMESRLHDWLVEAGFDMRALLRSRPSLDGRPSRGMDEVAVAELLDVAARVQADHEAGMRDFLRQTDSEGA